jgi:hypothetical protein
VSCVDENAEEVAQNLAEGAAHRKGLSQAVDHQAYDVASFSSSALCHDRGFRSCYRVYVLAHARMHDHPTDVGSLRSS